MKTIANYLKNNWIMLLIGFGVIVSLGLIFFMSWNENKKNLENKEKLAMYERLQDTLKTFKDENNNLVNQISVLESSNSKYFTELQTSDETIKNLQKLVKKTKGLNKPGGTAVVIDRIIQIDTVIQKEIEYIVKNEKLYFKDSLISNWIYNKYERFGDRSKWTTKVRDSLSLTIVNDKGKKYAEITNYSPYSNTKNLRVWQFDDEKKKSSKWGIGLQTGYGIFTDNLTSPKPYFGIGISRNIITF